MVPLLDRGLFSEDAFQVPGKRREPREDARDACGVAADGIAEGNDAHADVVCPCPALDDQGAARVPLAGLGAVRAGANHVRIGDVAPVPRLAVHVVAGALGAVLELGPLQAPRRRRPGVVVDEAPSDNVELLVLLPILRVRLRQDPQRRMTLERRFQED